MMTLKDVTWDRGNGLEALISFGIDPMVELTEAIDREIDDNGDEPRSVASLNRTLRQYLCDLNETVNRLLDGYNKDKEAL